MIVMLHQTWTRVEHVSQNILLFCTLSKFVMGQCVVLCRCVHAHAIHNTSNGCWATFLKGNLGEDNYMHQQGFVILMYECSGQFLTHTRIKTCVPLHQNLPRTSTIKNHPSISSKHLLAKHYSVIPETVPSPEESIVPRILFLLRTSSIETSSSVLSRAATATNSINFRIYLWGLLHRQIIPRFTHYNGRKNLDIDGCTLLWIRMNSYYIKTRRSPILGVWIIIIQ